MLKSKYVPLIYSKSVPVMNHFDHMGAACRQVLPADQLFFQWRENMFIIIISPRLHAVLDPANQSSYDGSDRDLSWTIRSRGVLDQKFWLERLLSLFSSPDRRKSRRTRAQGSKASFAPHSNRITCLRRSLWQRWRRKSTGKLEEEAAKWIWNISPFSEAECLFVALRKKRIQIRSKPPPNVVLDPSSWWFCRHVLKVLMNGWGRRTWEEAELHTNTTPK